ARDDSTPSRINMPCTQIMEEFRRQNTGHRRQEAGLSGNQQVRGWRMLISNLPKRHKAGKFASQQPGIDTPGAVR
ncbi:MAG: hypothetical protein ACYS74_18560, partial [Planctomycetota bacterium]